MLVGIRRDIDGQKKTRAGFPVRKEQRLKKDQSAHFQDVYIHFLGGQNAIENLGGPFG
jgi:hypothetical protein